MVKPLQPPANQVEEEEEDNEEEIICTHLELYYPTESPNNERETGGSGNSSQNNTGFGAEDAAKAGLVAGAAGVAVPTVATAGLTAAGFTGSGIAAGSMAAGVQAGIGNVVAGSTFATLQSIGATGGFAILGPLGVGAFVVGGGSYLGYKLWKNSRNKTRDEEEQRRKDEEEKAKKKLLDDSDNGGGGGGEIAEKPLCPECRKKLMLRITKQFCNGMKVSKIVKQ